ncbi:MAG TPA: hypothetical protein VGR28_05770 [Candidatus Thermoplasmatota archaeon]|jgi:hypothetical protein|nr:hypothetical protein [Candidatus Thermoplasmatota archaeon]
MRRGPRPLASLLMLLFLAPLALGQAPAGRPLLAAVQAPTWSAGDGWDYNDYRIQNTANCNQTDTQGAPLTVRVAALEDWNGTPSYRLEASGASTTVAPATPDFPFPVTTVQSRNITTWHARSTLGIVHQFDVSDTNTIGERNAFKQLQRRTTNVTFLEPMDRYQFPIVGAVGGAPGDVWFMVQNTSVVRNTTFVFERSGAAANTSYGREERGTSYAVSTLSWLRQDLLTVPAGTFDVIVLQESRGNFTTFEAWAPAAGNFVQQQILDERGCLVESLVLARYTYQAAPATARDALGGAAPVLAVVAIALVLGAAVLVWRRRARQPPSGGPPGTPPAEPPAS